MSKYIWPARQLKPHVIAEATRAFARQPVVLSDQFGKASQLQHGLRTDIPSFLFLGSTNVGKSSLLTSLLRPSGALQSTRQKPRDYPHVSKRQGFTRTLSFYTLGRYLRVVDSPGYGYRSRGNEGTVVTAYLDDYASTVAGAYVLVAADKLSTGFSPLDIQVMAMVSRYGLPVNIVITKSDRLDMRGDADIANLGAAAESAWAEIDAVPGSVYITSTSSGQGIPELRGSLWETATLSRVKLS